MALFGSVDLIAKWNHRPPSFAFAFAPLLYGRERERMTVGANERVERGRDGGQKFSNVKLFGPNHGIYKTFNLYELWPTRLDGPRATVLCVAHPADELG